MTAARRALLMRQYISRSAIILARSNIARCVVSTPALAGTLATPMYCLTTFNWSDDMKYLIVAMAVGAAALAGGSAANAAGTTSAKQNARGGQPTDISAQHRHHHHGHRQHHWRPHHYGHHRPHYYRNYGYYPRHHGYYGGGPYGYYGGGGPGVTFSFGGGRW
jgi:Ni/Co efflux regulator RcnB